MNTYTLESFISFCDDMIIAEEKIDLRFLDGNFKKEITLFHGSYKKLSRIEPLSINMGNRLNSVRSSSFWTNNFDYALIWALDWVAIKHDMPFCHDINGVLGNRYYFVVPDYVLIKNSGKKNEQEIGILQVIEKELKENPVYVYQANIPTKYVGRGQCPIDEYTVDIPVKPQKTYEIDFNTAAPCIKVVSEEEFDKLAQKDSFSKDKLSLREKLIFRNSKNVKIQRQYIYNSIK